MLVAAISSEKRIDLGAPELRKAQYEIPSKEGLKFSVVLQS
jgi:hypothetical protein